MRRGKGIYGVTIAATLVGLFLTCSLHAATLRLESGSGEPGDTVVLSIHLDSTEAAICGLNFDLGFDTGKLDFKTVELGAQAKKAGKSLSSSQPSNDVVRVLVIGLNQNIIESGGVVKVTFALRSDSPKGSTGITLSNASITDCSGTAVVLSVNNGTIVVGE